MHSNSWIELGLFFAVLVGLTPLLGRFISMVLAGDKIPGLKFLLPVRATNLSALRDQP